MPCQSNPALNREALYTVLNCRNLVAGGEWSADFDLHSSFFGRAALLFPNDESHALLEITRSFNILAGRPSNWHFTCNLNRQMSFASI
jgi:hypothetical protein